MFTGIANTLSQLQIGQFVLSFCLYFIGGYLMYASMFAAIGSVSDAETDTQQFQLPITIPLILGLFIMMHTFPAPGQQSVHLGLYHTFYFTYDYAGTPSLWKCTALAVVNITCTAVSYFYNYRTFFCQNIQSGHPHVREKNNVERALEMDEIQKLDEKIHIDRHLPCRAWTYCFGCPNHQSATGMDGHHGIQSQSIRKHCQHYKHVQSSAACENEQSGWVYHTNHVLLCTGESSIQYGGRCFTGYSQKALRYG